MIELNPTGTPRVRFAPSPTGKLHIGGARTAIYNWAFARATGGTFILRIEDTDPERSTKENVDVILNGLKWLGLDWDEGPEVGGTAGPYFQMQRMDTYKEALQRLIDCGAAYPCFCTKEELDAKREAAQKNEGGYSGYDGTCRDIPAETAQARIDAGEAHVWRLRVPKDHAPIEFDDAVYGHVSFPADVMDDLILVRSDGSPTYNFAVVCDDMNMGITHVVRGDDHLSNTPRQILIYEALEYTIPTFAHLSMILGPDGKKLSKRHGATSVEEYRDRGFLSDAMVNFLSLLGWSLDGETTIISREILGKEFSFDRVTKKDAVFDETKLSWMNAQYIKALTPAKWVDASLPWIAAAIDKGTQTAAQCEAGILVIEADSSTQEKPVREEALLPEASLEALRFIDKHRAFCEALYPLLAERLNLLAETENKIQYFFWGSNVILDQKSVQKVLLKEGARAKEALQACLGILEDESIAWECTPLQDACRALCEPLEIKAKLLFQPLRVAICGNMVSPPLFESIELMDRKQVCSRIRNVIAFMEKE